MKCHWLNARGFVGPIGDDLPSLIPLTVALLVFFAGFGFAFNHFEEKKTDFNQRLLLLGIGKTLKGDGLLDNFDKWKKNCESLSVLRYSFRAVVFKVPTKDQTPFCNYEFFSDLQSNPPNECNGADEFTTIDDTRILELQDAAGTPRLLACQDTGIVLNVTGLDSISSSQALAKKPLRINFPLVVSESGALRPAILSVMVWNK